MEIPENVKAGSNKSINRHQSNSECTNGVARYRGHNRPHIWPVLVQVCNANVKLAIMASFALLKTITRQGCRVVSQQNIINRAIQPRCLISTSKKNKDAAAISEPVQSGTNEKLGDKEEVSFY